MCVGVVLTPSLPAGRPILQDRGEAVLAHVVVSIVDALCEGLERFFLVAEVADLSGG